MKNLNVSTVADRAVMWVAGKSACGKKEAKPCRTLVGNEMMASRLTAAGKRRYDEWMRTASPHKGAASKAPVVRGDGSYIGRHRSKFASAYAGA